MISVADQQGAAGGGLAAVIIEKGAGVDDSKIRVLAGGGGRARCSRPVVAGGRSMPGVRSMR